MKRGFDWWVAVFCTAGVFLASLFNVTAREFFESQAPSHSSEMLLSMAILYLLFRKPSPSGGES